MIVDVAKARRVASDPDASGPTLLACAAAIIKDGEFPAWDPEAIRLELRDAGGVELTEAAFNRLMGAVALTLSDGFWQDPDEFVRICNALWDGRAPGELFDPADADEMTWAVICEAAVEGRDEPPDVSPDVLAYVRERLAYEGITNVPGPLKTAFGGGVGVELASFSDDPAMHSSVAMIQQAYREEIEEAVAAKAEAMRREFLELGLPDLAG